MLRMISSIRELDIGKLKEVYLETNSKNGQKIAPFADHNEQLLLAEADFYTYVSDVFFRTEGAVYCVWQEGHDYMAAMRIEPYMDGLLLSCLETMPEQRRKGYATRLVRGVLQYLSECGAAKVYCHIDKKNKASLSLHKKCGFQIIRDSAVYLDGSVYTSSFTLCAQIS